YYFPVTAGTQYTIKCRDSRDTNTDCCSADIVVSAYDSNGNTIFSQADNGFTTPHVFVASITGYVYVKVEPKLISGGTYQIRFRSP
ncbi:MAG: hypothetical protein OEZ36_03505, partial [Spirochaetota bacterium]|nr:hypothetical protein [Spirochaetota bacterium]